jgi:hypothetical protein
LTRFAAIAWPIIPKPKNATRIRNFSCELLTDCLD